MYNLGIMVFISLANFLFARLWYFGYIIWGLYPQMMYSTLMIGIIPIMALGAFSLNRQEKKYRQISDNINQQNLHEQPIAALATKKLFGIETDKIRFR